MFYLCKICKMGRWFNIRAAKHFYCPITLRAMAYQLFYNWFCFLRSPTSSPCFIFWPAFGCCAPQMLVKTIIFSIFSAKMRKKQEICRKFLQKTRFFILPLLNWLYTMCFDAQGIFHPRADAHIPLSLPLEFSHR